MKLDGLVVLGQPPTTCKNLLTNLVNLNVKPSWPSFPNPLHESWCYCLLWHEYSSKVKWHKDIIISNVILLQGAVFDIPSEDVDMILEEFESIKETDSTLKQLSFLPPLQEDNFDMSSRGRFEYDRSTSNRRGYRFNDFDIEEDNQRGSRFSTSRTRSSFHGVRHRDNNFDRDFSQRSSSKLRRSSSFQGLDDDDDDIDVNDFDRRSRSHFSALSGRRSSSYHNDGGDDDEFDDIMNRGVDGRFRPRRKY